MTSHPSSPPDPVPPAEVERDAEGGRRAPGGMFWKWAPYTRSTWALGLDLGQSVDPSAVAIVERRQWFKVDMRRDKRHRPAEVEYRVRHLDRLSLGVPYPEQARYIARLMSAAELAGADLVIDATGIGRAVLDIFHEERLRPVGVTLTSGDTWTRDGMFYRLGKLPLVSRMQALIHSGQLQVAAGLAEAEALKAELGSFRVGFNASGYASFNAASGRHDDLVIATALGAWWLSEGTGGPAQFVQVKGI